jgi:manganese transport protein
MKKYMGITLGIMTALGGFLDLGQIAFTAQAGAYFGYRLLWAIVIGTAAIILLWKCAEELPSLPINPSSR